MSILIDDMYSEIINKIGLIEQLKFRCTNKFHTNRIKSDLLKEYFDFCKDDISTIIVIKSKINNNPHQIFFDRVCGSGYLILAKWLNYFYENLDINSAFIASCQYGYIDIAKWLCQLNKNNKIDINYSFIASCENNHIDVAKWLYQLYNNVSIDDAFINICKNGNMSSINIIEIQESNTLEYVPIGETIKWLYSLFDTDKFELEYDEHGNNFIEYSGIIVCVYGQLDIAKWLYSMGNINFNFSQIFYKICSNGHIEVAKWLYYLKSKQYIENSFGGETFDSDHEDDQIYVIKNAFRISCEKGYVNLAKWLYSLNVTINRSTIDICFRQNCNNGNIVMAKWLYELGADIRSIQDYAFRNTCANGHLELAKWLYELGANISTMKNYAFKFACKNGHIEVAKWLYSIGKCKANIVRIEALKFAHKNKHTNIIEWLAQTQ